MRCEPTNPVPPVTSVLVMVANGTSVIQTPPVSTPTAIVADTTSYLPPELNERHDIHLVSLYVQLEGEQQRESEITDYDAFYERLRASGDSVTTSQPSIGDFIAVYEPLLAEGREIVSVHLSAGISGTFEAANQARERLISEGKGGERIHTVDSRSAAGGTAMVLLAAAEAALRGADAAATVAKAEEARDGLRRSGSRSTRSSTCAAAGGSAAPRPGSARR